MALIVEDGTGKPDAESFCSVADANKYFKDRGVTEWDDLGTPDKEIYLRRATDHIETWFGERFSGFRTTQQQALSWPRYHYGTDIPAALRRACAEYALRASKGPLTRDPTVAANGMPVKRVTEKLGPLEETTEYDTTSRSLFQPYPAADNLLKSLLRPATIIR